MERFKNRVDAGRRLARALASLRAEQPIVLALPRGGVPVAAEVARALDAPLDVLVARKIGAPENPEYGIGAVAEDGVTAIHDYAVAGAGLSDRQLAAHVARVTQEVARRAESFRDGRPPLDVKGRIVVLIDDGLATGVTATAAARLLRKRGAKRVILAVPVCAPETAEEMKAREVDDVVCLLSPTRMFAVGAWYEDFSQVQDEEVMRTLAEAAGSAGAGPARAGAIERALVIRTEGVRLAGDLAVPEGAPGVVIFAHGSGSSRHSPRNQQVAGTLRAARLGTLLFDLLTPAEASDRANVFDIDLLGRRLAAATEEVERATQGRSLRVGYFGASTGAAAALVAAARRGTTVSAVVSRGGRPDLAKLFLPDVKAPTLLIVGELDEPVLSWNREAREVLRCPSRLVVIPGATHLFEEPGALEEVARLAGEWFVEHLGVEAPAARDPA